MARSMSFLDTGGAWPSDDGWPYADDDADVDEIDVADHDADLDVDLVSLQVTGTHLLDDLDPLQRRVVTARFGLDGHPARTMRELQAELGLPRDDLRHALGDGLAKVRSHLA
jgi:DNA-directed RNA polymerase sigma subunit (sigma70/sigma32)